MAIRLRAECKIGQLLTKMKKTRNETYPEKLRSTSNRQTGMKLRISSSVIRYSSAIPKSACISAPHSLNISICLSIFRGVPRGTHELAASKGRPSFGSS